MEEHHNPRWLYGVLEAAVNSFNGSPDKVLLMDEKADDGSYHGSVGERAIAHRLAIHIERIFAKRGYPKEAVPISVDCEYNRHRGAVKVQYLLEELKHIVEDAERTARKDPNREGWYFFSVFPDIIVHERGEDDHNLIVVELKRVSNDLKTERDYDHLKLELFTKQDYEHGYGYKLGASIVAVDRGEHRELIITSAFFDVEASA